MAERIHTYERHTGRLVYTQTSQRVDTAWYDRAGNLEYSGKTPWYNPPNGKSLEDHANYYGADNRLRVAEFRTLRLDSAGSEANQWTVTFESYRYDALGRRVAIRTWRNCDQAFRGMGSRILPCNLGSLKRVVWSGEQELYEIRQWASQGDYDILPPRTMLENDTTPQWVTREYWDASREFGRVAYTYGPEIDQPLSAIRLALVDTIPNWDIRINWPPIDIAPHWNFRGQPEIGSLADGQLQTCQTTSKGQRCVGPPWRLRPFAFVQQRLDSMDGWWGSFLRDKEDGTGTLFRRNRYVDPRTGRFTQEDPIGLAGGLNLYGFAAGDPVNFSDPFGLNPCRNRFVNFSGPQARCALAGIGRAAGPIEEAIATAWAVESAVLPFGFAGRATGAGRIGSTLRAIRAGRALVDEAAQAGRGLIRQEGDRILTANKHVLTGSRASRAAHDFAGAGLEVADVAQAVANHIGDLSRLGPGYSRGAVEVGGRAVGYSRQTLESGETIVNFWLKQ